jgi:hypothetical protein
MAIAEIIGSLVAHDVELIVVGGVAAVPQGAPVHTIDWDIVYAVSEPLIAAQYAVSSVPLGTKSLPSAALSPVKGDETFCSSGPLNPMAS